MAQSNDGHNTARAKPGHSRRVCQTTDHHAQDNVHRALSERGYNGVLWCQSNRSNRPRYWPETKLFHDLRQRASHGIRMGQHPRTSSRPPRIWNCILDRDVLADPDIDYEGVLNRMMHIPMIACCYITIGGTKPGEGAVIARDRNQAVKPFSNGVWKLDAANGTWYLLQTNNDHWTAPPDIEPSSHPDLMAWSYERATAGYMPQ